jgi:hypothetical protein
MTISKPSFSLGSLIPRWALLSFFISAVFLYLRTFLLPAVPLLTVGDESHYFLHALRMMHGQLPYRDYFTFVPPGTDLLYVGIFRLLGVHQWVVQGLLIFLGVFLSSIVMWDAQKVLCTSSVILTSLLFLVFDFNSAIDATHHWWSVLLVMAAVGVLLGGRSSARIVLAGSLCGFATLFTQTYGSLSLLAIALYLFLTTGDGRHKPNLFRELLLLCLPFASVLIPVVGYYAHLIGFRTLTYWTIYYPLVFFRAQENNPLAFFRTPRIHGISGIHLLISFIFMHTLVPLIYILCAVRLVRKKRTMDLLRWKQILLLTLVGSALFVSIMSAPTFLRVCAVGPPAIILCVWYLDGSSRLHYWSTIALWTAAITSILYLPISRQLHQHVTVNLPTGRVAFISDKQYDKMLWLAQHTHPGETFLNDTNTAFALSLESPGPLDFVTTTEFTRPQQIDALLLSMTDHQTRYIYLYPSLTAPIRTKNNLEPFLKYLGKNYHLAEVFSDGQILERN